MKCVSKQKLEFYREELYNSYASSSTITVFKSRRMTWGGIVERMGEMRNT